MTGLSCSIANRKSKNLRSRCPSMLAYQRYKRAAPVVLFPSSSIRLKHPDKTLRLTRFPNRNNQPTSNFELSYQRFRYIWTTGSNKDGIVRGMRGPPKRAIKAFDRCHIDFQLPNPRLGLSSQIGYALDRINLSCNHR